MIDFTPDTGTIFDSPWFTFERPAFKAIASSGDVALTMGLIALGLFSIGIAVYPRTPAIAKAILLAWFLLP